ncbi:flavodoxin reductase [Phormidesmis priestleyi ULC007]|uniref:Ferredoxin--NADP reductase n=1 Tax=Phormidesmis priestleyi ULC007 TaxID=1920490 RepID=A0A2T1D9J0_9CYAN|nr:FHA domain-containing protein [Phormidesmis priestleyi]PSB17126.1 flavodoxin reductase [Phormidesmis priestleyi ULC007]PZO47466.1 MAG: flavodoxin reductase [Phormidesmis priestleyi]
MLILKSVNFEQREFQNHQLQASHPGQTEWVIGRSTTCDLVLMSPEVSRVHGRIVYLDPTYYFVDVGSASGSLLNGETIPIDDPHPLQPGDLLQLGQTFLHVEALVAPLSAAAETAIDSNMLPTQIWAGEDLLCRCCRIVDETPDVKTFCFVAEPPVLFCYQPGQFVNLEIVVDNKPVIRCYSISSSPTRPYHLSVTVKRVPSPPDQPELSPGLVSNWLHDHLKVGDRVKLIGGAMGNFSCLPQVPSKLLLISAGSGITPMMSMVRWVQDTLTDCDIIFLYSAASPEDIVFRAELEAIAAQMPNLRLAITVTRPSPKHAWMGLTGRISESMLPLMAPDFLERSVYVCGSEGFMQTTRSLLEKLEFPMQNYQEESFGGKSSSSPVSARSASEEGQLDATLIKTLPSEFLSASNGKNSRSDPLRSAQSASQNTASVIHFTKSDQRVLADDGMSILEAAEQEGVQLRHACRVGACGACKVSVQKGEVRYQTSPTALTIADQKAGYVLTCVAYPVGSLEIDA